MRNGNPNGTSTGKGAEEKKEDGDIEKRNARRAKTCERGVLRG